MADKSKRKVNIRMTVTYDVVYSSDYTKEDVEFHRNDGSWCADNAIDELVKLADGGCLCTKSDIHFKCLSIK